MGMLVPAALGLLATIPGIVALYFLRLRRQERRVSSTWLWQAAEMDRQANRPWQRLRFSWLLVLQVLAALALALAAAHPYRTVLAGGGGNLVVLLDGTAAMQATDGRWAEARSQVAALIAAMAPGDRMGLVLLSRAPEVLVADAADPAVLRRALDRVRPGTGDGDLAAGLDIAVSLLRGKPAPEIILVGNGRYLNSADLPRVPVPFRYLPVGQPLDNLAITAFGARSQGSDRAALAQVTNFGQGTAAATVQFWADDNLLAVAQQSIAPGTTRAFTWPLPTVARRLEVRLPGADGLALDNQARLLVGAATAGRILLVTPGNPFLERALRAAAGAHGVTVVTPDQYRPGDFDLTVLDGWQPPAPPSGSVLSVAAGTAAGTPGVAVTGSLTGATDHPALAFVNLSGAHVFRAQPLVPPPTATPLVRAGDLPLLWIEPGRATLAFDLRDSDLPLQPAFPILVRNLVSHLLPPAPVEPLQIQPGQPVTVRPWPGAQQLRILRPDGGPVEWPLTRSGALPFTETDAPGWYEVEEHIAGRVHRSAFAANLFSHLASNLTPAEAPPLPAGFAAPPAAPRRVPLDLWTYLAAFGLGLVALEWWFYRRGHAV